MTGAGVRCIGKSGEKYTLVQTNRARFSSGALQWQVLIALCPQQRRFAVAKAGERRDASRKTAGIRWIPDQKAFTGYNLSIFLKYIFLPVTFLYIIAMSTMSVIR